MIPPSKPVGSVILVTSLAGVLYFLEGLAAQITPGPLVMIAGGLTLFGLVGGLVVTLIFGVRTWRKSSSYWMMPSFICLVGLSAPFITLPLGEALNDWDFKRHLGDYERIINEIKVREIPENGVFATIDLNSVKAPRNVVEVWATRCSDGAVVLYFLVGGARYQKGYLFKGCDNAPLLDSAQPKERRYTLTPLVGRWYHFSDRR